MSVFTSPLFLRRVLQADAVTCIGSGVLQLVATAQLAQLSGLSVVLLTGTGVFLLVYAAAVLWVASRSPVPRAIVWLVVAGNLGWAIGCIALVAAGGLNSLGQAYVLVQALTVAVLAQLQWLGLRRAQPGTVTR